MCGSKPLSLASTICARKSKKELYGKKGKYYSDSINNGKYNSTCQLGLVFGTVCDKMPEIYYSLWCSLNIMYCAAVVLGCLFGLDGWCLNILFTHLSCKCLAALPHLSELPLRSSHKPSCSDTTAKAFNWIWERNLLFTTWEYMPLCNYTMGITHNILARENVMCTGKFPNIL